MVYFLIYYVIYELGAKHENLDQNNGDNEKQYLKVSCVELGRFEGVALPL